MEDPQRHSEREQRPTRDPSARVWDVSLAQRATRPTRRNEGREWDVVTARGWPDGAARSIASEQKGLITYEQLRSLGLTPSAIGRAVSRGRLVPRHRAVYTLGHVALPPFADELAAVLACGDAALLSHGSAAALWGLIARPVDEHQHVIVVGGDAGRRRPGICVHRVRHLEPIDITRHDQIPVTSPARTLLDLATVLPPLDLQQAVDEAIARNLVTQETLREVLERYPRRRGATVLARRADDIGVTVTRSEAERRFLSLVRKAGLPKPIVNVRVGKHLVDFLWREQRVVVEIDGFAFHGKRWSFERDRRRDAELQASGYVVLRFTWRALISERDLVLVRLAQTLARADRPAA
jgi:very-short-patch-repair endonuclease